MSRYVVALVLLVSACAPREPDGFTSAPLLTVGHGAFIAPDGTQITPDLTFVERSQRYYIASLLERAQGRETVALDATLDRHARALGAAKVRRPGRRSPRR